jgi:hypothetical protein
MDTMLLFIKLLILQGNHTKITQASDMSEYKDFYYRPPPALLVVLYSVLVPKNTHFCCTFRTQNGFLYLFISFSL